MGLLNHQLGMFRFPMMDRMDRSWEIFGGWDLKKKVPDLELLRILEDLQQIVESIS